MGSFSWLRADMTTQRANLTEGDSYKILVPIELRSCKFIMKNS